MVENNLLLERLDISGCNSLTDTLLLRVLSRQSCKVEILIKQPDQLTKSIPGLGLPHKTHPPHSLTLPMGLWGLHRFSRFSSQVATILFVFRSTMIHFSVNVENLHFLFQYHLNRPSHKTLSQMVCYFNTSQIWPKSSQMAIFGSNFLSRLGVTSSALQVGFFKIVGHWWLVHWSEILCLFLA